MTRIMPLCRERGELWLIKALNHHSTVRHPPEASSVALAGGTYHSAVKFSLFVFRGYCVLVMGHIVLAMHYSVFMSECGSI